jgi:hypothetical protein
MPAKKRHRRIDRAIPSELAFIDSRGNNRDEARELLNQAVDFMLDHLAGAERRSPAPDLQEFPDFAAIPDEGMHKEELLKRAAFRFQKSVAPRTVLSSTRTITNGTQVPASLQGQCSVDVFCKHRAASPCEPKLPSRLSCAA